MDRRVRVSLILEDQVTGELKRLESEFGGLGKQISSSMHSAGSGGAASIRRLTHALKSAIAAGGALYGIKSGLEAILTTGAKFQTLQKQLNTVMGSVASGKQAFDWIVQFAQTTPFQLDQVTKSFLQLKAMGVDPTAGAMKAVGDAVAAMGGSAEMLDSVTRAVGQISTKGKASAEELMQLAEAGLPVFDILKEKLHLTGQEVSNIGNLSIDAGTALNALFEGLEERYGGAMSAQMKTLAGSWSNFKDQISRALNALAQGGVLNTATDLLHELTEELAQAEKSGALDRLAASIHKAAGYSISLAENLIKLLPIAENLAKVFAVIWIAGKVRAFVAAIEMLPAAFSAASLGAEGLSAAMGPLGVAIGAAVAAGEGLAALFDRMNSLDGYAKKLNESVRYNKALAESIKTVYGSVQRFNKLTGMTVDQAEKYIATLKRQGKLAGQWAKIEGIAQSILKATVATTKAATAGTEKNTAAKEKNAHSTKKQRDALKTLNDQLDMLLAAAKADVKWYRELDGSLADNIESTIAAADANDQQNLSFEDQITSLGALAQAYGSDLIPKVTELNKDVGDLTLSTETMADAANRAYADIQRGFGDVMFDSITGRFGDLEDAWKNLWKSLASDIADALSGAVMDALHFDKEKFLGLFVTYAHDKSGEIIRDDQGNPVITGTTALGKGLAIAGGLAGVYAGYQQGGIEGALTGGVSGALVGSQILPGVGTIIGGIIGLAAGLLGGSKAPPTPTVNSSWAPGTGATVTGEHVPSGATTSQFAAAINATVMHLFTGYMDLLGDFLDKTLFDAISPSAMTFPEMHTRDLQNVIQDFLNKDLPQRVEDWFRGTFHRAFGKLGASDAWVDSLFQTIRGLNADERLRYLGEVVTGLVSINKAIDDLDWSRIQDLASQTPMERVTENVNKVLDQVSVLQSRMSAEMDLSDAAKDASKIAAAITQAGTSVVQMLSQIQQAADNLHRSIQSQIEGLQLGMMSPQEQQQFVQSRIKDLLDQLGTASSVSDVQLLQSEIQKYVQQLQGILQSEGLSLTDEIGMGFGSGQTWGDYLISILQKADTEAQSVLSGMSDQLQGLAGQLQDAGETTKDILLSFGDDATQAGQSITTMGIAAINAARSLDQITSAAAGIQSRFSVPRIGSSREERSVTATRREAATPTLVLNADANAGALLSLIDWRVSAKIDEFADATALAIG